MWELAFIPSSHPFSLFHLTISVFQRVLVYVSCVPHVSGVGSERFPGLTSAVTTYDHYRGEQNKGAGVRDRCGVRKEAEHMSWQGKRVDEREEGG